MDVLKAIEQSHRKSSLPKVKSGDMVRVHQTIREGSKQRIQIFEGVVIRTHRLGEISAVITVRRIASGVGVEKTFLLHSPNIPKVEIMRRSKVRRHFLSYLRDRRGKSARLKEINFDRLAANVTEPKPEIVKSESKPSEVAKLAAEQAADDQLDANLTEVSTDSLPADVSIEEVIKDENQAVASDDPDSPIANPDSADEQQLPAAETQAGLDKADNQDSRAQRPVE